MGYTDMRGLPVSTTSSEALAAYEQGWNLSVRWRSGGMEALQAAVEADANFVMAHCARTYIGLRLGQIDAALESQQKAQTLIDTVPSERERLHIQAAGALTRRDRGLAQTYLSQIADHHPADRQALWVLGTMSIAQGHYEGGLALARRALEACPEEMQFQTMTGFFLEQSGYNEEGLAMSLQSLANDPTSLYTYHAVGHAYHARGDYLNTVKTFERAASLEHYGHVLWHLGEAQALLGNERMTREYWGSTAPMLPLFERIELLWRLEVIRHALTEEAIWQDLAAQGERLLQRQGDYLTVWIHHWIGLAMARAGETEKAQHQLDRIRALPEGRASGHWSTWGADLLAGEMAFLRDDLQTAVRLMAPAVQHIHTMGGGSREQKDIFQDVYLELLRRLGHTEQVIEFAQRRLLGNPSHLQSLAALAWAYEQTGQTTLQYQVYRQLVQRAETLRLSPQLPELYEARQALQATAS